ncbi:MAG: chemotaxis protein CheD [Betaproteobacteria bacterium]|nr:chemotaxis protein CheD [Rhodocyclales bacterium]
MPSLALPVEHDPKDLERRARNINPGGWTVETERPITTLLGSCVAVCLYDPKLRLAGMNHFLLPSRAKTAGDDTDVILAGDYSMEVLLNTMLMKGAVKQRIVAKAFGGGTIVTSILMAIGQRNAEFAQEWLAREGIALTAQDFGGAWSRKVIFTPDGGDAFCRRLPITQPGVQDVVKAERDYEQSLIRPAKPSGEKKIELF